MATVLVIRSDVYRLGTPASLPLSRVLCMGGGFFEQLFQQSSVNAMPLLDTWNFFDKRIGTTIQHDSSLRGNFDQFKSKFLLQFFRQVEIADMVFIQAFFDGFIQRQKTDGAPFYAERRNVTALGLEYFQSGFSRFFWRGFLLNVHTQQYWVEPPVDAFRGVTVYQRFHLPDRCLRINDILFQPSGANAQN